MTSNRHPIRSSPVVLIVIGSLVLFAVGAMSTAKSIPSLGARRSSDFLPKFYMHIAASRLMRLISRNES